MIIIIIWLRAETGSFDVLFYSIQRVLMYYSLHSLLSVAQNTLEVFRLIRAKGWSIAEERYSLRTILRALRTPQIHSICLCFGYPQHVSSFI